MSEVKDLDLIPTVYDAPKDEQVRLTMFDRSEPRSLINIVWKEMQDVLERAQNQCRELFKFSERQLKKKADADPSDDMLRLRFWQEYDRAQMKAQRMFLADIIRGICSKDYWEDVVCRRPEKLAYMLTPLAPYLTRMESNLYIAQDEVEDILRTPHKRKYVNKKTGEESEFFDVKLAELKVKIWEKLDLRVKGAIVQKFAIHQRVEQKTEITNGRSLENITDLNYLDRMIEKQRREIERAQNRELLPADSTVMFDRGREMHTTSAEEAPDLVAVSEEQSQ